jgi:hypothetical protein
VSAEQEHVDDADDQGRARARVAASESALLLLLLQAEARRRVTGRFGALVLIVQAMSRAVGDRLRPRGQKPASWAACFSPLASRARGGRPRTQWALGHRG